MGHFLLFKLLKDEKGTKPPNQRNKSRLLEVQLQMRVLAELSLEAKELKTKFSTLTYVTQGMILIVKDISYP